MKKRILKKKRRAMMANLLNYIVDHPRSMVVRSGNKVLCLDMTSIRTVDMKNEFWANNNPFLIMPHPDRVKSIYEAVPEMEITGDLRLTQVIPK